MRWLILLALLAMPAWAFGAAGDSCHSDLGLTNDTHAEFCIYLHDTETDNQTRTVTLPSGNYSHLVIDRIANAGCTAGTTVISASAGISSGNFENVGSTTAASTIDLSGGTGRIRIRGHMGMRIRGTMAAEADCTDFSVTIQGFREATKR